MHLALFDFDGTISTRDTTWDFILRACGRRRVLSGFVHLSPMILSYSLKRISHHEAKQAVIRHYFGDWEKDAFIRAARHYARTVVPTIIRPEAASRINRHLGMGHTVAVVTGSLEVLLSEWCTGVGVDLIATGIDLNSASIGLSTRNCFREEKARRVREKYDLGSFETIYAYGDSSGDREMMALAHERYYRRFD
ncbi:MAG TPA: HAD-IB family phosphatase [Deltaproteobacteria bacterium]|jgi:HAD superfamily phosphoserine phosphatase-like hydrolase|nr:HAD-IB family phosphatase [Deltaproteobacteria bacterium]HQI01979.1 HAD-IB family phosphatase [Deltaproteobacteria bacterium]HQJ08552.1 HAD-IB family phosphatase [Deltaproteobacteria bacterium]